MVLRSLSIFGLAVLVAIVFTGALFIADHVANDQSVRMLVERYGYIGILFIAFLSGLNLFLPVPAATFAPIFAAAGYTLPTIVLLIVIGSTVADVISYALGAAGRSYAHKKWPQVVALLKKIETRHKHLLLPFVFLYAALVPIPNEAILIPLALLGVHLRVLILPILLGAILHHSILVYGAQNVFELFF